MLGFPAQFAPAVSGAISLIVIASLLKCRSLRVLDRPNARSLHSSPVPRTGGLGVIAGVLLAFEVVPDRVFVLTLTVGILAVVSFLDDLRGLPAFVRLIVHIATALVLVYITPSELDPIEMVAVGAAIGWMTNLFNFMDGMDGFAGGMATIGFGAYALAAAIAGDPSLAILSLSVSAAAAVFLIFNFPPARLFLGDVGSIPLGFLAGALGFLGWSKHIWPAWFPVATFAPFVVDATVTLLKRTLKGKRIWEAHRDHYYQRIVRMGWTHRRTVLYEYLLMLVSSGAALWAMDRDSTIAVLILGILGMVYVALMVCVDFTWRQASNP